MLSVTLYEFKKRENSTKRPDSTVTQKTHNAVLKMPTSLLRPEITFDFGLKGNPSYYNYARISDLGGRYYFITDWTVAEGHLWTAHMEVDVLASWKESIGASTQYVIRSSAAFDGAIVDTLYPTKQGVTVKNSTTQNPFKTKFEDGRYVLGIVNADTNGVGANHYYVLTQAQLNALSAYLLGESNWLDISDISDNLTKALFNPFQYIVSCNWFPFAVGQKNTLSALPFGWWNIPVSGAGDLASLIQRGTTYLDIPKHPQATRGKYLNGGPYTDLALFYPGFGTIALDANRLVDVTRLILVVQVDCVANTARLIVGYSNNSEIALDNIVGVYYSQVGITIPMGQLSSNMLNSVGGVVTGAAQAGASYATGNMVGFLGNVVGAIGSAVQAGIPTLTVSGQPGSMLATTNDVTLTATFYSIADEDNEDRGRPYCKKVLLSTLPGYQVIADPDLSLSGTSEENRMVKNYLASGYFYE